MNTGQVSLAIPIIITGQHPLDEYQLMGNRGFGVLLDPFTWMLTRIARPVPLPTVYCSSGITISNKATKRYTGIKKTEPSNQFECTTFRFQTICYIIGEKKMSGSQAQSYCKQWNATLPHIENYADQSTDF